MDFKLKMMGLGVKALSREELKKVSGGVVKNTCACFSHTGAWTCEGFQDCLDKAQTNCGSSDSSAYYCG